MFVHMYRSSKMTWIIESEGADPSIFPSIEDACAVLEDMGVSSEEVDSAIMESASMGNTRMSFDIMKGTFVDSDNRASLWKGGFA